MTGEPTVESLVDSAALLTELHGVLREVLPPRWWDSARRGDRDAVRRARAAVDGSAVVRALAASGWLVPDWPEKYGGRGLPKECAKAVAEELRRYQIPRPYNVIGLAMAAPTLRVWGTEEQKIRYLPPLAGYDETWCQLFSEPGAGSDLAGLSTRAVRAPDDQNTWIIDGQKVWSSMAHEADYGLLLARTDPSVPKRKGITYFLLDMRAPGVSVRPLRQITGESEFNEVFLTGVRVPDHQRLGPVDRGWEVAATTLLSERSALSGAGSVSGSNIGGVGVQALADLGREAGAWRDSRLRDRLASVLIDSQLIRVTNARAAAGRTDGHSGIHGSLTKLMSAELNQRVQHLAMDVLGAAGVGWRRGDPIATRVSGFLRAQANTVEGGTSEIMRTIIGERVLGLPREPDPWQQAPWSEVPRPG